MRVPVPFGHPAVADTAKVPARWWNLPFLFENLPVIFTVSPGAPLWTACFFENLCLSFTATRQCCTPAKGPPQLTFSHTRSVT